MRFATASAVFLAAIAAACEPAPQPQPNEMEAVVNATRIDQAAPPGALGNESVNVAEGNITPAERNTDSKQQAVSAAGVVEQFANLIVQRRFDEAHQLWDPEAAGFSADQLAQRFERFETMQAALRDASPAEGAAGSVYDEVQLTISGTRKDGSNYTVTGPVTLKRANDVPGSTAEQRDWRIVKMVLTSNPVAADALVDQQ